LAYYQFNPVVHVYLLQGLMMDQLIRKL